MHPRRPRYSKQLGKARLKGRGSSGKPAYGDGRVDEAMRVCASRVERTHMGARPLRSVRAVTLGVLGYGKRDDTAGYAYGPSGHQRRQAIAMDRRGFRAPQCDFLASASGEPPHIECDEDVGTRYRRVTHHKELSWARREIRRAVAQQNRTQAWTQLLRSPSPLSTGVRGKEKFSEVRRSNLGS